MLQVYPFFSVSPRDASSCRVAENTRLPRGTARVERNVIYGVLHYVVPGMQVDGEGG